VFGDLRAWGWLALILGALQVLAAAGVLAGNQVARWFAVVVAGLNALALRIHGAAELAGAASIESAPGLGR
jgi:hypothetical protein